MKWVLFGNLLSASTSLFIILIITRLGSSTDVGTFSYIQGVILPVSMFFTFKLRTIQSVDHKNNTPVSTYHDARKLGIAAFFVVAFLISYVYLDRDIVVVSLALILSYSFIMLRETFLTIGIKERIWIWFFYSNTVYFLSSIIAFGIVYFQTNNLAMSLFAIFGARMLSYFVERGWYRSILGKQYFNNQLEYKNRVHQIKQLVIKGSPLALTAMLGALFMTVPKVVLEAYHGLDAVGVFTIVTLLLFVFNLLTNSYVQSMTPELARLYVDDIALFKQKIARIVLIILISSILVFMSLLFAGEQLLTLGFGQEYHKFYFELALVAFSGAGIAMFSVGNLILSCQERFAIQPVIYGIVVVALLVLCLFLGKSFGVRGVIISQSIAYTIGFSACVLLFIRTGINDV